MKEKRCRNLNFNAESKDHERLEAASLRLSLTRSEVARRALRVGLDQLEQVFIPGGAGRKNEARTE